MYTILYKHGLGCSGQKSFRILDHGGIRQGGQEDLVQDGGGEQGCWWGEDKAGHVRAAYQGAVGDGGQEKTLPSLRWLLDLWNRLSKTWTRAPSVNVLRQIDDRGKGLTDQQRQRIVQNKLCWSRATLEISFSPLNLELGFSPFFNYSIS